MKISRFFCCTLILIAVINLDLNAQDQVVKKDGTTINGKVSYSLKQTNDIIKIDRKEIDIKEVRKIIFTNEIELHVKEITYFDINKNMEIIKYALLKPILDGDAKLYSYSGKGFQFVIQIHGKFLPIQKWTVYTKEKNLLAYKIFMLDNLEGCVDRKTIFESNNSRNSLISLLNKYNRCKKGEPIGTYLTEVKKEYSILSFSFGVNHATHSLEAKVNEINNGELRQVGEIQQLHIPSYSLALDLFFRRSLPENKNILLQAGMGFRRFDFEVKTLDEQVSVQNLTQNELNIDLGLNIRVFQNKKIVPEASLGAFYWLLINPQNLESKAVNGPPVLESKFYKKNGVGLYYQIFLNYYISENWSMFFGLKQQIRPDDDIYTNEITETFLRRLYNDILHLNLVFSVGTSVSLGSN